MTTTPIRPALLASPPATQMDAATAILRMLTSDRLEPALRCRADGEGTVAGH